MITDAMSGDVFDIRDVIKRFEELEGDESRDADDEVEFGEIKTFLDDVCGSGGDEQWRGDWYPVTFIRDDYFEDYAREFAEDVGAVNDDASWPNNCIDWEKAARELRMDYSAVEIGGTTYWFR